MQTNNVKIMKKFKKQKKQKPQWITSIQKDNEEYTRGKEKRMIKRILELVLKKR